MSATTWVMDVPVVGHRFVFERDATRYDVIVVPDDGRGLMVMLPEFRRCARVGRGCEKYYLAEKLDVSLVDAQNIVDNCIGQFP